MADDLHSVRKVEIRGVPSDLWHRVRVTVALAGEGGLTMSAWVVAAIAEKLERERRA